MSLLKTRVTRVLQSIMDLMMLNMKVLMTLSKMLLRQMMQTNLKMTIQTIVIANVIQLEKILTQLSFQAKMIKMLMEPNRIKMKRRAR